MVREPGMVLVPCLLPPSTVIVRLEWDWGGLNGIGGA